MRKSKFTEEQIIGFLKQAEAGMAVAEICRKGGFQTRRSQVARQVRRHGGVGRRRLRELEAENAKLKSLLAEAHLDMHALKSVLG
ncbi:MAG: transposase [Burkholderiales bacterium]|nr:transposase [Burkholderiales bacterium]